MRKLSKQEQVIFDLLKEKPRTAREIIYYGGTNYPSSKVRDLKSKGIKIETVPQEGKNYDIYRLAE